MERSEAALGVVVYGLFDIQCGLRVAAENTVRVLEARGQTVQLESIQRDGSLVTHGSAESAAINLFHANPDWLLRMLPCVDTKTLAAAERLNACVPFWELTELPTTWLPLLSSMDVLLAPTEFIADAIRVSIPTAHVVCLPQAVFLPDGIAPDRERFGIPHGAFAVAMSFAGASGVDRKNPWAAVQAFLGAFPTDPQVRLVVRLNEQAGAEPGDMLSSLREAARDDPRVLLITGDLDYRETLTMYASCDVYVSLHRSEGLGLGPMEAMSLGLPVVATGWSGNMDFMTADNSFPVDYRLVPVDVAASSPYAAGVVSGVAQWAEPDVEHASRILTELRNDVSLRAEVGRRAAAAMEQRRASVLGGGFIAELADAYAGLRETRRANRKTDSSLDAIHRVLRRSARVEAFRARAASVFRLR